MTSRGDGGTPKFYEIDAFRLTDIKQYKKHTEELLKFQWDYYSELAFQRSKILGELQLALIDRCTRSYRFDSWQRVIRYKYSLDPLNTRGSLIDPGGRFNIGDINPNLFPPFSALYMAVDKDTALQETLGQNNVDGMSPQELALTDPQSISVIAIKGELDQLFDLHDQTNLEPFLDLIKGFKLSRGLQRRAQKLRASCQPVRTMKELLYSFVQPNWREFPMLFDIPSNSQLFGQIVSSANIQGILYPSKLSSKQCLAVFPKTFKNSSSYVQLVGDLPNPNVPKRIDSNNYESFC